MRQLQSYLLIALVVVMAACASQSSAVKPTPTATFIPLPTQTPTPTVINQTPLTSSQAWGNVHVAQYPVTYGDRTFQTGGAYGEDTVTDDDQVCGQIKSATTPSPDQIIQSVESLALFNLHTTTLTTLATFPAGYQVVSCAVTGSWVIWSQAYGDTFEMLQQNWQVKALNRQTQEVRVLDQGKLPNGHTPPPYILPYPSASDGHAAWTTFANNQADPAAVMYDFATGHKTFFGANTSFPLLAWPWVSYGDANLKGIVFKNLETQQQSLLNQRSSTTAFAGTAFVASNANYSAITLYPSVAPDQIGTSVVVGQQINGDGVEYPTVNDRLVTWQDNDTFIVFDRKLQRLVQFAGLAGRASPLISGHYLIWGKLDEQKTHGNYESVIMEVIDTNTLP